MTSLSPTFRSPSLTKCLTLLAAAALSATCGYARESAGPSAPSAAAQRADNNADRANPHVWDGRVKRVAVFKNGLGFFMREGRTQYHDGWALAAAAPPAAFGTLAIYSLEEGQYVDVVGSGPGQSVAFDGDDAPDTLAARRERLDALLGLKLQVEYRHHDQPRKVFGELESIGPRYLILAGPDSSFAVALEEVTRVQVLELPLRMHVAGEGGEVPAAGEIGMAYLRKGITWIPDYTLEIIDEQTAELTLRGTLVNEAEDLVHCDVSFVVGVPHFVHSDRLAPLAVGQVIRSVSESVAPQQLRGQMVNRAAIVQNMPGAAVGYDLDLVRADTGSDGSHEVDRLMGNLPQLSGAAATDYTVYTKEDLTLRRGEKAIVTLFRKRITYSHAYAWTPPGRMEHKLVLHNETDTAWTTGPCLALSGSSPLSEDLLKYVPRGGKGELPVATAVNISHDVRETEVERKLKAHNPAHNYFLDLVTLEGTLTLKNYEKQPVELVIEHPVPGRPLSAESDGDIRVDTSMLNLIERRGEIRWKLTLQPGESRTLTYRYERYVPSR